MGGDDVIGRPLGGACVPTQRMLSDLKEASEDASLPQSVRKLALDLAASSAPSFEGLRAVYRALGVAKGLEKAPSLQEALSGGKTKETRAKAKKTEPEAHGAAAETEAHQEAREKEKKEEEEKPRDPALAARLQALRDASDQAAYDACVADLTEGERRASGRSGHGLSLSLAASAPAAGLALSASAGTGYAAGFVAARALFPDEEKHPAARHIGGLAGLVAALAVEAGLVVVRAVRAEREERLLRMKGRLFSSSNSSSSLLPLPKITRRLTEAELAAEAEVAAAVVAGAATAARAGAEERAAEAAARAAAELEAEKDSAAATTAATAATAGEAKKQR